MASDKDFTGGCGCGAVRFTIAGPPVRVGLCHCMTCRKAHASAFNPFAMFRRDQVALTGELRDWESSPGYLRRFCPACGSRVIGGAVDSAEVELSLGSLDEPGRLAPGYEMWVVRREPWLAPLDVPQRQGNHA